MVLILDTAGIDGKCFLVTGGAGALGQSLCMELHHRGAKSVKCFDWKINEKKTLFSVSTITTLQGDVRNKSSVVNAMRGIDTVFHVATFGNSWNQMLQKQKMYEINVLGTSNVVHACLETGVKRLIYTNDCHLSFGNAATLSNQTDINHYKSLSNVAAFFYSKSVTEKLVLNFNGRTLNTNSQEHLFTCVVKPGFVYHASNHFPSLNPLKNTELLLSYHLINDQPNNELAKIDWISMDNSVHAHLLACKGLMPPDSRQNISVTKTAFETDSKPVAAGKTYFVTDGPSMSFFDFFIPLIQAKGQSVIFFCIYFLSTLYFMLNINTCLKWFNSKLGGSWLPRPWVLASDKTQVFIDRFSSSNAEEDLEFKPLISRKEVLTDLKLNNEISKNELETEPSFMTWLLVCTGLTLLFFSAFVPPPYMGMLEFVREAGIIVFMSRQNLALLWWLSVVIHLFEASVAFFLAIDKEPRNATKWFFQTLILGYFSLRYLLRKISSQ